MRREVYHDLLKWKSKKNRKPLVLFGARQVGKTWLMKEFGKNEYENVAYFNFEINPTLGSIFEADINADQIIASLSILQQKKISTKTLLIFDEIQETPRALTSLKYFFEQNPEYHLIAAGSLLGVGKHPNASYPVGKVDILRLFPLSFFEFLRATRNEQMVDLLLQQNWNLIEPLKNKFIELLKQYFFVGGMPEVVSEFANNKDFVQVRKIQKSILSAYEHDFSKHPPGNEIPKIRLVWQNIPAQLAKENKKFVYKLLKSGARAKEFENALLWLENAGLIHKVHNVSKPSIPLISYQNLNAFKIYFVDVGLLTAFANISTQVLLQPNTLFTEFKGSLTEQFVAQEVKATFNNTVFYWNPENARAEIDFVFERYGEVFPLEVKAAENLQSKSLKVFHQKFTPKTSYRTSMSNYRDEGWLINVPLYAIQTIFK